MVLASGSPVESSNIQMFLALPTGEVIIDREFNTIATLEYNGTYSCIALLNGVPTVASLPVIVYGKEWRKCNIMYINLQLCTILVAILFTVSLLFQL